MILHFDKVVALTKYLKVLEGSFLRTLVVVRSYFTRYLSGNTSGQADESLVVLFQEFPVNTRLAVKAVNARYRYELYKVFVALVVLTEQYQMIRRTIYLRLFIKMSARCNVYLTADYRLDVVLFSLIPELDSAVHIAVVCYCNGCLPELLNMLYKSCDTAGTVKQAVLRMNVEIYKAVRLHSWHLRSADCPLSSRASGNGGLLRND